MSDSSMPGADQTAQTPPALKPVEVKPPGVENAPTVPEGHGIYREDEVRRWREQADGFRKFTETNKSRLKELGYESLDDALTQLQTVAQFKKNGISLDGLASVLGSRRDEPEPNQTPDIDKVIQQKFDEFTSTMTRKQAESEWASKYRGEIEKVEQAISKLPESVRDFARTAAEGWIFQHLTPDQRPFEDGHVLSGQYGNPAGLGDELASWLMERAKTLGSTRPAPAATPGGSLETDASATNAGSTRPRPQTPAEIAREAVRKIQARKQTG